VEEKAARDRFLLPNLERCLYHHPVYRLSFRKDPSFWEGVHEASS